MNYKHCCVVDANNLYKTFVIVYLEPGENGELRETISGYELAEGERLLEVSPPSRACLKNKYCTSRVQVRK